MQISQRTVDIRNLGKMFLVLLVLYHLGGINVMGENCYTVDHEWNGGVNGKLNYKMDQAITGSWTITIQSSSPLTSANFHNLHNPGSNSGSTFSMTSNNMMQSPGEGTILDDALDFSISYDPDTVVLPITITAVLTSPTGTISCTNSDGQTDPMGPTACPNTYEVEIIKEQLGAVAPSGDVLSILTDSSSSTCTPFYDLNENVGIFRVTYESDASEVQVSVVGHFDYCDLPMLEVMSGRNSQYVQCALLTETFDENARTCTFLCSTLGSQSCSTKAFYIRRSSVRFMSEDATPELCEVKIQEP